MSSTEFDYRTLLEILGERSEAHSDVVLWYESITAMYGHIGVPLIDPGANQSYSLYEIHMPFGLSYNEYGNFLDGDLLPSSYYTTMEQTETTSAPWQDDAALSILLDELIDFDSYQDSPPAAENNIQDLTSTGQFATSMPGIAEARPAMPDESVMPQAPEGSRPSPFMYSTTSGCPVGVVELTKSQSVRAVRRGKRTTAVACLFCRRRKIACGGPPVDNPDKTCMQCKRRRFTCEYPEHRNGAREYKFKQTRFSVDEE